MKPFLGIDLTTNRKNEQYNGEELVVATPSLALQQAIDSTVERVEETEEQAKLPLTIRIVQGAAGAIAALVGIGLLKAVTGEDSISVTEAYENAFWMFWLAGGCLLLWGVLKLLSIKKQKTVMESDESTHVFSSHHRTANSVFAELGVPDWAPDADVLLFYYKEKDGEIKVREKGLQRAPYMNPAFKVFVDKERLYLVNLETKFAIPRENLTAIRLVKKSVVMAQWNKEAEPTAAQYKPYKVGVDGYGRIHAKPLYILEFTHNGEPWGLYFPSYELPTFEKLTGLKAE